MKVLITGTKGKLVNCFCDYCNEHYPEITIDKLSLRDDAWKEHDFSNYDAVIHCAGIIGDKTLPYSEYEHVNVQLSKELICKVKAYKVSHFIYISSMAVFGKNQWRNTDLSYDTVPNPDSFYGISKYEAEKAILEKEGEDIKISMLRVPAIVGKGMEGYFDRYIKMARIPFIPIPNVFQKEKRSFVYVDTLCEFIVATIKEQWEGILYPQNLPLLSVSQMYSCICESMGVKRVRSRIYILLPAKFKDRFFGRIICSENVCKNKNERVGKVSSLEAIKLTVSTYGFVDK